MSDEAFELGTTDAARDLLALPRHGDGIGLHRMLHLAQALDASWWTGLDAIRVTGSKGKGSVAAMAAAILRQLGLRTGLYTSPHLLRFHERIRIDGRAIPDPALRRAADWALALRSAYEARFPGDRFGAFEVFTAVALRHFQDEAPDGIVTEVGIGGRYDPTRVIPGRCVALTSIELEHTAMLGATAEAIAYDKSDLCGEGGTIVAGRIEPEVLRRLRGYCAVRGVEVIEPEPVSGVAYDGGRMRFSMTCEGVALDGITTPLLGDHQAANAAVAALVVRRWLRRNRPAVDDAAFARAVRSGLSEVVWPGRLQRVHQAPEVWIDVGHTPQSARAAGETFRRAHPGRRVLLVTGVSGDKDAAGILAGLVPAADAVVCTRAHHKGAPVSAIAAACESIRPGVVWRSAPTVEEAIDAACARAAAEDMVVLVGGGLFLAVEAWVHLRGGDPRALRFF